MPGVGGTENLMTTLKRAEKGGYSSVLLMPNTAPMIDSPASVRLIKERAKNLNGVEVLVSGCLTVHSKGESFVSMGSLKEAGISAVTDCPKSPKNNKIFINAVKYARMFDLPVIEYPVTSDLYENSSAHESLQSIKMGLQAEPRISEELSVHRAIAVSKKEDAKIHLSSISTSGSVDLIRTAKNNGLKITADTTANHLLLNEHSINQFDTNFKTQPFLREEQDRQALQMELLMVQLMQSHLVMKHGSVHLKGVEFDRSPSGATGLETTFHASYKALSERLKDPIPVLIDKLAIQPRKILGLELPFIKNNNISSFNIISLDKKWRYDIESAVHGSAINSLLGTDFITSIELSYINGKINSDKYLN